VTARPRGEAASEERRLGEGAGEVEGLERVHRRHGAARRGETTRQLDGGGKGRREEDEGPQAQGARRF
jgi:hypothetical protein